MWMKDVNVRTGDESAGIRGRNGALCGERAFPPLLRASSSKHVSRFPQGESSGYNYIRLCKTWQMKVR